MTIVYDTIEYFCAFENGIFREGYEGFRVEEATDGTKFVVYREIHDDGMQERRFVLPPISVEDFIELEKRYSNFIEKQHFLLESSVKVEALWREDWTKELKEITDEYYERPDNYVHFVAMNMSKSQFYFFVQERLEEPVLV